jgi:hypothetical protein
VHRNFLILIDSRTADSATSTIKRHGQSLIWDIWIWDIWIWDIWIWDIWIWDIWIWDIWIWDI